MNADFATSKLILANDLTIEEQEMVFSHRTGSDVLVSILPKIPTQFYLLPSMRHLVETQTEALKESLKKLGEALSIPPSRQVILESQFLQTQLLHFACEHQFNFILIPQKWSALKYLAWWYKRNGVEIENILDDGFAFNDHTKHIAA